MELGDIFREKGGDANLAKAAAYYEKAARRGHRDAPYWLGAMAGGAPEAAQWYELAAERGNRKAQSRLAEMYRAGEGVERDLVVAAFWSMAAACPRCDPRLLSRFVEHAAKRGHAEAQYRLARTLREDEAATWMRKAAAAGHEGAKSALGRC